MPSCLISRPSTACSTLSGTAYMTKLPHLHTDTDSMTEHSITIKFCMSMTRSIPSGTWVGSAKPLELTKLIGASSRYHPKRALQEGSRFVLPSESASHQLTPPPRFRHSAEDNHRRRSNRQKGRWQVQDATSLHRDNDKDPSSEPRISSLIGPTISNMLTIVR